MDKLINTLCFHLIDISNGAILQLSRYYKLYLLWLKEMGNSLCARFMFQSKWGRNWCFYWLRILWIEIIAFAMGIASCIGMVLFSSVLLGRLKKNSHKVANCQMAHEDNDRLKNIFYLLILDTDSFQNFSDLRINGRSPNTQPYWAPAVMLSRAYLTRGRDRKGVHGSLAHISTYLFFSPQMILYGCFPVPYFNTNSRCVLFPFSYGLIIFCQASWHILSR